MRLFYIYITASHSKRLYIGVTNSLTRRVWEHQHNWSSFTARYRVAHLVYFEVREHPMPAILREKQIKGWLRKRKVELIEKTNPMWLDLSAGWYD